MVVVAQFAELHLQVVQRIGGVREHRDPQPLVAEVPVDVQSRRVFGVAAVPENVPPPRVHVGNTDAHVVGDDVEDQAEAVGAQRCVEGGKALDTTSFLVNAGEVNGVVAVRRPGGGRQQG